MFAPRPPHATSSSFNEGPDASQARLNAFAPAGVGFRSLLGLLIGLLATPLIASSAAADLGYLQYSAGAAFTPNQNLVGDDATGAGLSGSAQLDAGYTVGLAVGTDVVEQLGAVLRTEIALNWRSNEVDGANVAGEPSQARGDLGLFTAMINAYVDYDLKLPIVPYVGFGVGYGLISVDAENLNSFVRLNDEASVFAYNAMVGGTLAFTTTTDFMMEYRYVGTTDPKLEGRVNAGGGTFRSQRFESEYDSHELVVGMRVNF